MLADHAKAMHRVCFDSEPSEADLARLGSRERWLVYRDLVRTRLLGVVEAALPRTRSAAGKEVFGGIVDEWMSAGGPQTRYFRHVPNDLTNFALPILRESAEPWVADLARYEIATWSVRHAPPNPTPDAELTFEAPPVVGNAVIILRLDHPVHESPTPTAGYPRAPVILCLHRNEAHRAIPQKLNPLAADLLEGWQGGDATVAETVQRVAADHGVEIGPAFVEKLSTLIADFITKGILLGGRGDA
jgi:hypothetical protein